MAKRKIPKQDSIESPENLIEQSFKEEKIQEVANYISKNGDSIKVALRKASIEHHEFFAFVSENKDLKKIIDKAISNKIDYMLEYTLPDLVLEKIKSLLSTELKVETKTKYVPNPDTDDRNDLVVEYVERQEKERDISPVLLLQLAQQLVPQFNPDEMNTADISRRLEQGILKVPDADPIDDTITDVEIIEDSNNQELENLNPESDEKDN